MSYVEGCVFAFGCMGRELGVAGVGVWVLTLHRSYLSDTPDILPGVHRTQYQTP
ncbi:hypothetical protein P691DRAFT_802008, partial [Macrolepiota fuliginosa MF-IS2]